MIGVWPAIARAKHLNHTSNHIRIRHFHTHTHKVLSNNNLDLVHCSWGSVLEYVTDQLNSEFVVAITQTFRELSSLVVKLMSFFWLNEYFISIKLREGRSGFNYFA